jgi:predicted O-methyltransferase YrrM
VKRTARSDGNRRLVARSLGAALRSAVTKRQELRYHVLRDLWAVTRRFGARHVENVELRELPDIADAVIEGYIDDPNRAVLAALCRALGAKSFFEIGTNRGRTAWTVARNNPDLHVHTLDLPSPDATTAFGLNESDRAFLGEEWASGEAFHGTPEGERITALFGDSGTFDFGPWDGQVDVVFVDGAHSYDYVRSDTAAALRMVSPAGAVAWDDYPAIPGVYRVLDEVGPTLDRRLVHVLGTRLAIYSRQDIVRRVQDYGDLGAA